MSIQHDVKDLNLAYGVREMGVSIDLLTAKQEKYLASWQEGS